MEDLDSKCSVEETCKAIRNSECKDGKCQCLANYKKRDGKCLGLDQAPCKISEDCFAENATCTNKKCVCSDGFYYENDHCYEKAKGTLYFTLILFLIANSCYNSCTGTYNHIIY
ncbi:hypothetical protein G9C98_007739 [Cotesia typhae]|uniref:EB domain-containing protein n=1 Tax=Cotesia typhae TaxID=2053667 RepID=A0A8J5QJQ9_9HYME|nr:hypothetical protein G9C98_007739 [Cotesia typhae]